MWKILLIKVLLLSFLNMAHINPIDAQNAKKLNRKGAVEYNDEKFENAAKLFEKASNISDDPIHPYNHGNALYKNENFEKAIESYSKSLSRNPDEKLIKKNLYNRGNAYHLLEKYDESIADYKNTLKIDPKDKNAKINLLKSKIKKRVQQQQKQQQNENRQTNKENNSTNDDQKSNTDDQNQENNANNHTERSVDTEDLSAAEQNESLYDDLQKSEYNRLLNMVENEDQKVNKKLKEKKSQHAKSKKDW